MKIKNFVKISAFAILVFSMLGCGKEETKENESKSEILEEKIRIMATQSDIATIQGAVTTYAIRVGKYPFAIDDLAKEIDGQEGLLDATALTDKWGTKYSFKNEGDGYFEIRSAGPDAQMNTADDLINSKSKAATRQ